MQDHRLPDAVLYVPGQLQVDHRRVVAVDALSELLLVLIQALHDDAELAKDVCIDDGRKKDTESSKAGLEDTAGLLVYGANELGGHVEAVEVLRPGAVAVDLVVVVCGRVLWWYPLFVDFGVVPPAAGEAVDVDYEEEDQLH